MTAYRFYAADESYFSGKVRPALRVKRVPHVELLPTPTVQREIIRRRTGLAMIPVIVAPEDAIWQDSSDILDRLEERFPDPPLYPTTPVQRLVGYLIELYVDEFLVLPGLHYRWSFPESEEKARADFAALTGDAERSARFADAVKGFSRLAGVTPETAPAIEAHAAALIDWLDRHLGGHPYLLGDRPSLGDCALMGPLYAHLYLDAVPGRLLRRRSLNLCRWIQRMNHPDPDATGGWLPGDRLPATFAALLGLIGADAAPFVLDQVRAIEAWADTAPPDVGHLPRIVGMHRTRLRGVEFERATTPYTLWMLHRLQDAYAMLGNAGRTAVDAALAGTGCEPLLSHVPRHRVVRRPFLPELAR